MKHPGYVKANGATVSRSDYPRLVAFADEHNLWDDDNDGLYGTGDGETTFRLPDLTGRFVESAETAGILTEAGLPDIAGGLYVPIDHMRSAWCTGAFYSWTGNTDANTQGSGGCGLHGKYWFSAKQSNFIYGSSTSVQPPSISLIPCIKY